jgi:predicted O-linked N-acetylglucosamine transferase (SPINDLY family)
MSSDFLEASAVGRALRPGFIALGAAAKVKIIVIALDNPRSTRSNLAYATTLGDDVQSLQLAGMSNSDAAKTINSHGVHVLNNCNGYTGASPFTHIQPHPSLSTVMQSLRSFHSAAQEHPAKKYTRFGRHPCKRCCRRTPAPSAPTTSATMWRMPSRCRLRVVHQRCCCCFVPTLGCQVPPEHAQFYSEKIVLLPGSAFLGEFSSSQNHIIESEEQRQQALQGLGISSGSFVLGNFNRAFKLDPSAFEAWMQVFTRVDDAVMLMFEWKDEPATISNILRAAGHHKQRIHFAKLPPVDQRFASKGLAHVFLDTPLYNAHGTATEVISAGVPVVSYASNTSPHSFSLTFQNHLPQPHP